MVAYILTNAIARLKIEEKDFVEVLLMNSFVAADGKKIYYHSWCAEKPWLNILLAHGMTEHSGRFAHFGEFLAEHGISLYALDQRGHGMTGKEDNTLGHLRKNVDWDMMMLDLVEMQKIIREDNQAPVFLMGHSMGSFLARCTVQRYPQTFNGLILSGTGNSAGKLGKAALQMAKLCCFCFGEEQIAEKVQNMAFGMFNKTVKAPQTDFDWLTRDSAQVQLYLEDDLCGLMCTNGFYHELLTGIVTANDEQKLTGLNKDMPIYLFSGDEDPVGLAGKGVKEVEQQFLQSGMKNVTCKLYSGGRHEMLNEINQLEVYADLYHWLEEQI